LITAGPTAVSQDNAGGGSATPSTALDDEERRHYLDNLRHLRILEAATSSAFSFLGKSHALLFQKGHTDLPLPEYRGAKQ
jgi:hypothetical protein